MTKENENDALPDGDSIKNLPILQLLMNGAKQSDIAAMLGVSAATMSRMIPKSVKDSLKGRQNG